ncbi:hypothetical protein [Pseudomonas sp.]|jgi:hypothetical protein|uniref:hypothetical protein n=1 Tax=Pseudomonas sp. TaxID=306 RepID=UPI003264BA5B
MNKAVLSETKTDDAQVNDGGGFAARVFNCADGGGPCSNHLNDKPGLIVEHPDD